MQAVKPWLKGPVLEREKIVEALESVIVSGDRIVVEGDNQKQADFPGPGQWEKDSRPVARPQSIE
jgi:malonate decarboxylase alpha subunit